VQSHDHMGISAADLEQLYRRRYRTFRHGAAAIVGEYERAHDVVQDAFARALAARATFRGGSAEAWVWRIVERQALDARGAAPTFELGHDFELELDEPQHDPALAAAIRNLPPRRRLVVFLRYFADLPYREIARLCGIDEGTVAATLAQAHADLRAALTTEGATR
jgi:RNA polymerase sigma factor (sigma-70 family)